MWAHALRHGVTTVAPHDSACKSVLRRINDCEKQRSAGARDDPLTVQEQKRNPIKRLTIVDILETLKSYFDYEERSSIYLSVPDRVFASGRDNATR